MHAIQVSHVAKSFGQTQAVAGVSFTIEHGEIFGLLGPNGAGKTTIINLLLGLLEPTWNSTAGFGACRWPNGAPESRNCSLT